MKTRESRAAGMFGFPVHWYTTLVNGKIFCTFFKLVSPQIKLTLMERFIFMIRIIGGLVLAVAIFLFPAGFNSTAPILIGVAGFV